MHTFERMSGMDFTSTPLIHYDTKSTLCDYFSYTSPQK